MKTDRAVAAGAEDFNEESYILQRTTRHLFFRARVGQVFYVIGPLIVGLGDNMFSTYPLAIGLSLFAFLVATVVRMKLRVDYASLEAIQKWRLKSRTLLAINTAVWSLFYCWILLNGTTSNPVLIASLLTIAFSTGLSYQLCIEKSFARFLILLFFFPPIFTLAFVQDDITALMVILSVYCAYLLVEIGIWHKEYSINLENELEIQRMRQVVTRQSLTDPLTNLANRRRYTVFLDHVFASARRNHTPLSLIVIDLDHFKQINDQHGHATGDECLIRTANILRNVCKRETDLVARIGGEEFAIVLPETGVEQACILIEKLRDTFDRKNRTYKDLPPVTFSAGIGEYSPERDGTPDDLFIRVDQAAYRAKQNGRNCIEKATA